MKHVDTYLFNGPVLTMTADELIDPGCLAVANGRIDHVGPYTKGDDSLVEADERIDLGGRRLVMPGLINSHTHAAMTIFRGLADDLPLMDWLNHYIFPVEKNLTAEWVEWGTKLACLEMIAGGTTTFCDMYLFEQAVAEVADQAGMRAVVGEVLYDFPSPNYGPPEAGLRYTRKLIEQWQAHDRISVAVEPHAPYTCSPELLRKCADLAREKDVKLVIHLAETAHEVQTVQRDYGCSPVHHLERLGVLGSNVVADHAIHLDQNDIAILARSNTAVAHNPQSNMKLASGTAPIPDLLAAGVRVGLGTDGCASNNNLDMFEEMDTAAKLHKVVWNDSTAMPAHTTVALATSMAADVLGLEKTAGKLAAGMAADLIVVDFDQPHLVPAYDYLSHLVYAVRGADVTDTMVAGRWLMRNRQFLTLDAHAVYAKIDEIAGQVRCLTD